MNNSSLPPMPIPVRWYDGLAQYQQQGSAHVLATIVAVNGSAPRALQAKMVITHDNCCDTLGGGGLEHDVVATARQLLNGEIDTTILKASKRDKSVNKNTDNDHDLDDDKDNDSDSTPSKVVRRDAVYTKHYPLGAKLAQCCGGSVTVMFECFNVTPPMSILVFGAGHVAAALMTILSELSCQVDWVDSRAEMFERYLLDKSNLPNKSIQTEDLSQGLETQPSLTQPKLYNLPAHIRPHIDDDPVDFIRPFIEPFKQSGQRFILVMTHDHSLDFELVRAALDAASEANGLATSLDNDDLDNDLDNGRSKVSMPYIGCIASATKAERFKSRLLQRGYDKQIVEQLTMPIGLPIGGKEPMAVAVSIAAQILQHYHQK
ncbi:XdhC family protein [Psychrobacter maritimus]|uniref:XdhC family protein n=1 Tax=Psychrobacter maritimus TaxID=256325 RepID=UPI00248ADB18|nr:XdhC family protein [Psychrobacter sp. WB2]WGV13890.1 XdhC family protein [Psychrobacter sp. WB2]